MEDEEKDKQDKSNEPDPDLESHMPLSEDGHGLDSNTLEEEKD